MLLETYTTLRGDELKASMPPFLDLGPEVTGDPAFYMINLSLKEEWATSMHFFHNLSDRGENEGIAVQEAQKRLDANCSRQGSPNISSKANS